MPFVPRQHHSLRPLHLLVATGAIVAAVSASLTLTAAPAHAAAQATAATMHTASSSTVYGAGPYLFPDNQPGKNAAALASSDPSASAAAATIAKYPIATWLGEWYQGTALVNVLKKAVSGAAASGTTPVFVTYAIPDRDCGGYSSGGFSESQYDQWVDTIASTLSGSRAVVIVEPDSLAMLSNTACSDSLDAQRYRILSREVSAFTKAGVASYLDAGNSNWVQPTTIAARLKSAGVANARGFFTNVANYYPTARERSYAASVSALTGGARYVIDTSRNGQGWKGTWCNGPGAGLGEAPRVVSDGTALDAVLWIKTPGASDGSCNGAPAAGVWYPAYAKALVANAVTAAPTSTASSPTASSPATSSPVASSPVASSPAASGGINAAGTALVAPAKLTAGQSIRSASGQYRLAMQSDGTLVQTGNGRTLWSTRTQGNAGAYLALQADGNAVVYSASGRALWKTSTSNRRTPMTMSVTDRGDLQLVATKTGVRAWHNGAPGADTMVPTAGLGNGQRIVSADGRHTLQMQADGDLVLRNGTRTTWHSGTAGRTGAMVVLQGDANLVIYDANGTARWASRTSRFAGGSLRLVLQNDGNLVLYRSGKAIWATHTSGR